MKTRLTDADIWKKSWFRRLSPEMKCFWYYITANCDNKGLWDIDFDLASFQIGAEIKKRPVLEIFKDHIVEVDGGKQWFVVDFLEFQNRGAISTKSNAHKNTFEILNKKTSNGKPLWSFIGGKTGMPEPKDIKKEFLSQSQFLDRIGMHYTLSKKQVKSEAHDFLKRCEIDGKLNRSLKDLQDHFHNLIRRKIESGQISSKKI